LLFQPPGNGVTVFLTFTVGSFGAASWDRLDIMMPWLLVAFALALACCRSLNLLQLGDDMAAGLGMRVTRTRVIVLAVAVLLVSPVVATVGPLAFVALLTPHIARAVLGSANAYTVMPVSAALAGVIVLTADTLGRLLFFPTEIPAGLWSIAVIGPIAIWFVGVRSPAVGGPRE
jgi:iron complex transport system permease protein